MSFLNRNCCLRMRDLCVFSMCVIMYVCSLIIRYLTDKLNLISLEFNSVNVKQLLLFKAGKCLSVYIFLICLSSCLSVRLSICLYICLFAYLFVCFQYVCLSGISIYLYLLVCPCISLFVCPSVYLSLSICLSVYLSICLHIF